MKLLLVRHAESNGNASGGDYSVPNADALSPNGLSQAETLAVNLIARDIDSVIVSPQQRAMQTITPYLEATGRQAEVWPELAEACWHDEREPAAESWGRQAATLPDDIARHFFFRDNQAIRPGPPHSFGAGLRRVHDARDKIEKTFGRSEATILMASHQFFIRELLQLMLKDASLDDLHHDNCGMTLMIFDKSWTMEFCNQQSQLV